ncbi:MAG: hypothetical protein Fur0022_40540 [Anaerolineales bacterium]
MTTSRTIRFAASMKQALLSLNRRPLKPLIIAGVIIGCAIGVALYPHAGFDWYVYFSQTANRPITDASVYYPAWIYLILRPITYLPNSFLGYTLLNAGLLIMAVYLTKTPNWSIITTLPLFWILFYGQIDAWLVFGVALAEWSLSNRHPVWMGLALLLLTSKPHVGGPLLLYYAWNVRHPKILLVPAGVLALSLLVFGFWPIIFLQRMFSVNVEQFAVQAVNVNISGWPYSLILLPALLGLWKYIPPTQKSSLILALTCITIPYCPIYSLAAMLVFNVGWLALILFPAWFGPQYAITWGFLFALACVLAPLAQGLKARLALNKNPSPLSPSS